MSETPLLPILGGALAGFAVTLVSLLLLHFRRRASGRDVVVAARAEAATLARSAKADAEQLLKSAQADLDRLQADATRVAERITADAQRVAESARADAVLAGKMETLALREELDRETQSRREEWARLDRRAEERERTHDRRQEQLTALEVALQTRDAGFAAREQALAAREAEVAALRAEQGRKLEQIAGLSAEEARRELLQRAEDSARSEAAALIRDIKEQARKSAERDAKKIVALAIQRIAADHTAEITVSAVALPNDEMKGRIIGREGRNIRAFELATGVDVIIDDTPDTVVVSCFDPIRREVARLRAREARRRRPDPSRAHRGGRREGPQGSRHADHGARRAGRVRDRRPRPASGARSSSSAGCSGARATGRTSSSTRRKWRWLAGDHGRRARASTSRWPSAARCCTTSARC